MAGVAQRSTWSDLSFLISNLRCGGVDEQAVKLLVPFPPGLMHHGLAAWRDVL